jgi:tRNA (adenine57-N1/adenine58-N1)-methyltransferase
MMIPLDPSHKPTSQHRIAEGDTVVVYERHDEMHAVTVAADLVLQNRFGGLSPRRLARPPLRIQGLQ